MRDLWAGTSRTRVVIGTAGVLLTTFGVYRLASQVPGRDLLALAGWLVGALVVHDAVLSPGLVGIGNLLRRAPARARAYLQGSLIAGGIVTVIALPMIYRTGSQPRVKAILEQDYRLNLAVLLAVIAATAVLAYLSRIVRGRGRRPPARRRTARPQNLERGFPDDHAAG